MTYSSDPDYIALTMATVDLESLAFDFSPKIAKHIYLSEKAPWVVLPDDGTERWGTWEFAHTLVQDQVD